MPTRPPRAARIACPAVLLFALLASPAALAAPERAAFFGEVVQSAGGQLVVRDAGASGALHTVQVGAATRFAAGSASTLKPGDRVFVAGDRMGPGVAATSVVVLTAEGARAFDGAGISAALQSGLAKARPGAALKQSSSSGGTCKIQGGFQPTADELDFTGCIGLGSYTFGANLNPAPLFYQFPDLLLPGEQPLVKITLSRFEFTIAAAGGSYELPFKFSAVDKTSLDLENWYLGCIAAGVSLDQCPNRPLDPGPLQPRVATVNAVPINPAPALSWTAGTGILINLGLTVYTNIGCGPAGLSACPPSHVEIPIDPFSIFSQVSGAAPLAPGSTLYAPPVACLPIGASLLFKWFLGPATKYISPFDMLFCMPHQIDAGPSGLAAKVTGAQLKGFDSAGNQVSALDPNVFFLGKPVDVVYQPPDTSQSYKLNFSHFDYRPAIESRLQLQFRTLGGFIFYETPEYVISKGVTALISTPFPLPEGIVADASWIIDPVNGALSQVVPPSLGLSDPAGWLYTQSGLDIGSLNLTSWIPDLTGTQPTSIDIPVSFAPGPGNARVDDYQPRVVDSFGGTKVRVIGRGFSPDFRGGGSTPYPGSGVTSVKLEDDAFNLVDVPFTVVSDTELELTTLPHAPTLHADNTPSFASGLVIRAWGHDFDGELLVANRPVIGTGDPYVSTNGGAAVRLGFYNPLDPQYEDPFSAPAHVTGVFFDGVPAAFARCDAGSTSPLCTGFNSGSGQIVAAAPPHAQGDARVTITSACDTTSVNGQIFLSPCGTSDFAPTCPTSDRSLCLSNLVHYQGLPQLTSLSQVRGKASGGDAITLDGSGFGGNEWVTFGSAQFPPLRFAGDTTQLTCNLSPDIEQQIADAFHVPISAFSSCASYSDTQIALTVPPGTPGTSVGVSVHIHCPNAIATGNTNIAMGSSCGDSQTLTYYYLGAPGLVSISPAHGAYAAGTDVVLTGAGFTTATQVVFGGQAVPATVVSDTEVHATAPAGSGLVANVPQDVQVAVVASCDAKHQTATACGTSNAIPLTIDPPANRAGSALTLADASGGTGGLVTLAASLTKSDGSALAGKTVTFTLAGQPVGSAQADASGHATLPLDLSGIARGSYALAAGYAGDVQYAPASAEASLTVSGAGTLSVASASGVIGRTIALTATAALDNGSAAGLTVAFSLGGVAVGSAQTDANGIAALSATVPTSLGAGSFASGVLATEVAHHLAGAGALTLQQDQLISFAAQPDLTLDQPTRILGATATSGLDVTLTSSTPAVCEVLFDTYVHGLAPGVCTITASQAGNADFPAAIPVTRSFNVEMASQAITFLLPAAAALSDGSRALSVSATSGLPVSTSTLTPSVCDLDQQGNIVFLALGQCTLQATQAGNSVWTAATATRTMSLFNDNRVVAWGASDASHQVDAPGGTTNVLDVSAADDYSLAVGFDGAVHQWGNAPGVLPLALGLPPKPGDPQPIAVSAAPDHALALMNDGSVVGWGNAAVPPIAGAVQIAAGYIDLAALGDGSFWLWRAGSFAMHLPGPCGFTFAIRRMATAAHTTAIAFVADNVTSGGFNYGNGLLFASLNPETQCISFTSSAEAIAYADSTFANQSLGRLQLQSDGTLTLVSPTNQNLISITGDGFDNSFFDQALAPLAGLSYQAVAGGDNGGAGISGGFIHTFGYAAAPAGLGRVTKVALGATHGVAITEQPLAATALAFLAADGTAAASFSSPSNTTLAVSAALSAGQSALAGRALTLAFAGQTLHATTDSSGRATFTLDVNAANLAQGNHSKALALSFAGSAIDAAAQASADLTVTAPIQDQSITLAAIAKTYGDAPFAPAFTASSGLPVAFSVASGPATLSGGTLTLTGAGTVALHATQAGNSAYRSTSADFTFNVAKAALTVTAGDASCQSSFAPIHPQPLGGTVAGLVGRDTVSVSYASTNAALINGTLECTGQVGTYPIVPTVTGNLASYSLTTVNGTLTVRPQGLQVFNYVNGTFSFNPVDTTATALQVYVSGPSVGVFQVETVQLLDNGVALASSCTPDANYLNEVCAITLAPGSHSITAVATQNGATSLPGRSASITVEVLQQPQTVAFDPVGGKTYGDAAFSVSATASSGLPVTISLTSGPATLNGNVVTLTSAGTVVLHAAQAGNANFFAASADLSIAVAAPPPALTLPSDLTAEATSPQGAAVTFTASAADLIDGAVAVNCSPASGATFAIGTTAVACSATNSNGKQAAGSFNVTVSDTTAPALALGALPALTNQAAQMLSVLATDAVGVTSAAVAVDGTTVATLAPAQGSVSALVPLALADGAHTVAVTASDAAGNSSTQSFAIAVDTQAPAISPTVLPAVTNTPDLPVVLAATDSGSGIASATVTLGGFVIATLTPQAPGAVSYMQNVHLLEGANALSFTVTDRAGNSATSAYSVLLDTVPPQLTVDATPALTNQRQLTLDVAASDENSVASIAVQLNGVDQQVTAPSGGPNAGLSQLLSLGEGSNTILVTAKDGAGNVTAISREVRLDTIAPAIAILAPAPGQAFGGSSVPVSVQVSDASGVTVTIGGQPQHVPAGASMVVGSATLAAGAGSIVVTAVDDAGNSAQASVGVLVDLSAPAISTSLPDGLRTGPLPGDALSFAVQVLSLEATTVVSQGSSSALPRGGGVLLLSDALVEGQNLVTVAATDESGRTATLTRSVLYDKTPPAGAFVSPAADGAILRGSVELGVTASDNLTGVASVTFAAGGAPLGSALLDTRALADGPVALTATLVDGVGNTATITRHAIVDNTPPSIALQPPPGSYVAGVVQLSATAFDATSGVGSVSIAVNGATVKTCAAASCAASLDTRTLQDGPFTVSAVALDNAGNTSAPASWTAAADNSSPAHFLVSPTAGATVARTVRVAVNVTDADFDHVECFVDGRSLGASTDPRFAATVDLSNKLDGGVDVACVATDRAGNQGIDRAGITLHRWDVELSPDHLNLKSDDNAPFAELHVRGPDAGLLVPVAPWRLSLQVAGGAPVPAQSFAALDRDGDDLLLRFDRHALLAALKAGVAAGLIDPKKPVLLKLVSGTHLVDTDNVTIAGADRDDGREASNDRR